MTHTKELAATLKANRDDTLKAIEILASELFDGVVIKVVGKKAIIKKPSSIFGHDKSFLVTHFNSTGDSFYWSTYDLTIERALELIDGDRVDS